MAGPCALMAFESCLKYGMLTLEKNVFPPLLTGFELATFRSRVRRSYQQATRLTLIRCPFHPLVTTVARKGSRLFCQKCRWQVTLKHPYTLDPTKSEWADYAAVQA